MTASNGSIGIRVQVPVLGVVSGVRTLTDIVANKPIELPTDEPAVVTRDISGAAPVSAAPVVAAAPQAKPVTGGLKEPAVTPKPPEAPASPDDQEAKAKRLMQLADNYVNAGLKSTAISKLKEIIKQYPDTKVAETAEEKLMKLER